MIKIVAFTLVLFSAVRVHGEGLEPLGGRQKKSLFYGEDNFLGKTHMNPYLQHLSINAGHLPYYGSFVNPFLGFLKELGKSLASISIPVSNQVVQNIKNDPNYPNIFMTAPIQDPLVVRNPLCMGQRTQVPSPQLCNNYLNCWDGWAVEQECPAGLLFSREGYCDYPDNVDCEGRKMKPQPPTVPQCNKDFESIRNQQNCNEFFVCVHRQPIRFKCPADLAYSQLLGVCDYPANVDCGTAPIISPILSDEPGSETTTVSTTSISASTSPLPESTSPLPTTTPALPITTPSLPVTVPAVTVPAVTVPAVTAPTVTVPTPTLPTGFPSVLPGGINSWLTGNSILHTQSCSSTHVAISRQDAIRQLQKGYPANIYDHLK